MLLLLILLLAPMQLKLSASYFKSGFEAESTFSFLHPALFYFDYSTSRAFSRIRIFGIYLKKTVESEENEAAPITESEKITESPAETAEPVETVSPQYNPPPEPPPEPREEKKPEVEKEQKVGLREKLERNKYVMLFRDRKWRKKAFAWLKRVVKSTLRFVVFKYLRIKLKVGLKDPAELGKLYGYCVATRSALQLKNRSVDVDVEPVFLKDHFEFSAETILNTSTYRILAPFMVALLTAPYLHTYKIWRNRRKKKPVREHEANGVK